jgi:hypothetical protein
MTKRTCNNRQQDKDKDKDGRVGAVVVDCLSGENGHCRGNVTEALLSNMKYEDEAQLC